MYVGGPTSSSEKKEGKKINGFPDNDGTKQRSKGNNTAFACHCTAAFLSLGNKEQNAPYLLVLQFAANI